MRVTRRIPRTQMQMNEEPGGYTPPVGPAGMAGSHALRTRHCRAGGVRRQRYHQRERGQLSIDGLPEGARVRAVHTGAWHTGLPRPQQPGPVHHPERRQCSAERQRRCRRRGSASMPEAAAPSMAQGPPKASPGSNAQALKFSECMRSHGEPDFPDPAANGSFTLPAGMNAESPQFQNAASACRSLRPASPGGGSAP